MSYSENRLLRFFANLKKKHKFWLIVFSKVIPPLKMLIYYKGWPVEPLYFGQEAYNREDYSDMAKKEILKSSPYGKCVFKCDNDVVDHQVVSIEFTNGTTASLIMHGFSEREGRTIRIDGTKATLFGEFRDCGQRITVYNHYTRNKQIVFNRKLGLNFSLHGGGDELLISAFIESIRLNSTHEPLTNARESLESHLMAFAADRSRLSNQVIEMKAFREETEKLSR